MHAMPTAMPPPPPSAPYGGGVYGGMMGPGPGLGPGDQSMRHLVGTRHCSTETLTAASFLPSSYIASGLPRTYDYHFASASAAATPRSVPRAAPYAPSLRLEPHPQHAVQVQQASSSSRGRGVGLGLSRNGTITPQNAMDAFMPYDAPSPNGHANGHGHVGSSGLTLDDLVHTKTPPQTIGGRGYSPGMTHAEIGTIFSDFDLEELMRQTRQRRPDHLSSPDLASEPGAGSPLGNAGPGTEPPSMFQSTGPHSPLRGTYDPTLISTEYAHEGHSLAAQNELDKVFGLGPDARAALLHRDHHSTGWRSLSSEPDSGLEDDAQSPFGSIPSPSSFPHAGSPYAPGNGSFSPSSAQLMYRTDSNASNFSVSSSEGSLFDAGVNPNEVNPSSYPNSPADHPPARHGFGDAFSQTWWGSRSMDALADGLDSRMAFEQRTGMAAEDENESTLRAKERTREGIGAVFSSGLRGVGSPSLGLAGSGLSSSLPTNSTISKARGSRATTLRSGSEAHSPSGLAQRAAKTGRGLFGITDYAGLPTKRSRGRRPIMSRDVGLADDSGRLADCVQSVPGGSAFDPTLNPDAAAVEFCDTTKTGKPKKIFVCKVTHCGKVFK